MTISPISRNVILPGIAVIITLSLLALTFAALHGFLTFGVLHAATHLVSHGRMLADGPTPPCNPIPGPC